MSEKEWWIQHDLNSLPTLREVKGTFAILGSSRLLECWFQIFCALESHVTSHTKVTVTCDRECDCGMTVTVTCDCDNMTVMTFILGFRSLSLSLQARGSPSCIPQLPPPGRGGKACALAGVIEGKKHFARSLALNYWIIDSVSSVAFLYIFWGVLSS
jgi:hypothetical protein